MWTFEQWEITCLVKRSHIAIATLRVDWGMFSKGNLEIISLLRKGDRKTNYSIR